MRGAGRSFKPTRRKKESYDDWHRIGLKERNDRRREGKGETRIEKE